MTTEEPPLTTEEPPSEVLPSPSDADHEREAARLRPEFPGWVVIWLASEEEFRAYRRLPGARRDTALRARTAENLVVQMRQAEQAEAPGDAATRTGQP